MNMRRARLVVLAFLMLAALSGAGVALAHAELARSEPSANSSTPASPKQIQLWFTEELEKSFSEVTVLDKDGARKDNQDSHIAPNDPKSLIVTVQELPRGTYTVVWKALSAADGHATQGGFPFAVGEAVAANALVTEAAAAPPPDLFSVAMRWLNFLAAMPAVGGFFFLLLTRNPALVRTGPSPDLAEAADRRFLLMGRWSLAGLFLGWFGMLAQQAAAAAGISPLATLGSPMIRVLTSTRFGVIWEARLALLLLLSAVFVLYLRGNLTQRRRPLLLIAGAAIGSLVLLTNSFNSHGAASGTMPLLNIFLDWLHLLSAAVWLGGLVHLLALLRFTAVALSSFGLLVVTGVYAAVLHVPDLAALRDTQYGMALAAKLGALSLLGTLGLVNMLFIGPRLAKVARGAVPAAAAMAARLRTAVGFEVATAAALLLAVAVMTSVSPSRTAVALPGARPMLDTTTANGLDGTLRIAPFATGLNSFEMRLRGPNGAPVQADRVTLRFTMQTHDMGIQELPLEQVEPGRYRAQASNLSMSGPWQVEAHVRRAGADDATLAYNLAVTEDPPGKQASQLPPVYPVPTNAALVTAELLALAVICAAASRRLGGFARWPGLTMLALAVAFGSTGGVLGASAQFVAPVTAETQALVSPVPADAASVAAGQQLYQQNCLVCHGAGGRGDGPASASLRPRPVDFTQHINLHAPGQIFDWISSGVPGTAMPAFGTRLSENERWNLYNFLKETFGKAPSAAPGP
ncbi:MAG: FixH family protein [Chloroflexi bacterium]|nr:FixH family protein [Chloroflexota bacterium]